MSQNSLIGRAVATKTGKCWHRLSVDSIDCSNKCSTRSPSRLFSQEWYRYDENRDHIVEAIEILCDTEGKQMAFGLALQLLSGYHVVEGTAIRVYRAVTVNPATLAEALVKAEGVISDDK